MELHIKRLRSGAVMPTYGTDGAAGLDLSACLDEPLTMLPGEQALLSTGIAIALPVGTVGLVYARSSMGVKHGITLSNGVGVIDEDYRGELHVGLINHGRQAYTIHSGDRIAQLIVTPYLRPILTQVQELGETKRGAGGFGSTGR